VVCALLNEAIREVSTSHSVIVEKYIRRCSSWACRTKLIAEGSLSRIAKAMFESIRYPDWL